VGIAALSPVRRGGHIRVGHNPDADKYGSPVLRSSAVRPLWYPTKIITIGAAAGRPASPKSVKTF
jgi:hypothetical protein